MANRSSLVWVALAVLAVTLLGSVYTVHQTQQVLVVEFGRPVRTVNEPGLHFKKPFIEDIVTFDKRLLEFNAEPKEITLGDKKRLMVDAFVRYRVTDPLKFYQTVRDERIMRDRLNSIVDSSLRQVMGGQTLSKVLSGERGKIMKTITDIVNSKTSGRALAPEVVKKIEEVAGEAAVEAVVAPAKNEAIPSGGFGVEVVDVRIMRADLPQENSEGIFRRMQTEREREAKELRAKGEEQAQKVRAKAENERTIILANAEKEAEILRGQGDAEATRIFAEAFSKDPEFFSFYRSIQAYQRVLSSDDTTMVLTPGSEFLRYMEKK